MTEEQVLMEFAEEIKSRSAVIKGLRGDEAMQQQMNLSTYIGSRMQELLSQGYDVFEVQKCLRDAMEAAEKEEVKTVSNESDSNISDISKEETDIDEIDTISSFFAIDSQRIRDYSEGKISKKDFVEVLKQSEKLFAEQLELLEFVLGDDKDNDFTDIFTGEVLAGADGEAFVPQWLEFGGANGAVNIISEPATYRTASEVKEAVTVFENINEKIFKKRVKSKKLGKLIDSEVLWESFIELKDFYIQAADKDKSVLLIYCYE